MIPTLERAPMTFEIVGVKPNEEMDQLSLFLYAFNKIPELEEVLGLSESDSEVSEFNMLGIENGNGGYYISPRHCTVRRTFDEQESITRRIDITVLEEGQPPMSAERIVIDMGNVSSDTDDVRVSYRPSGLQRVGKDGFLETITYKKNTPAVIADIDRFAFYQYLS